MRQILFALAALIATAAVIALPFFLLPLLARTRGGWLWAVVAIVVLAAAVHLARRERS
jgi:hypothetical protein